MKRRELLFVLTIFGTTAAAKLLAPSPQYALKIMGILFGSAYLLFYFRDIAIFWYKILAENAIRRNDRNSVIKLYRKIHRIAPGSLSGKAALAVIHSLEGKWSSAEMLYREVLRERPYDARLQYNLAVTLVKQEVFDEALRSLQLILRLYPGWAVVYSAAGEIYLALENYELSYKYFKSALLLDSGDQSALLHLPLVSQKLGQAA